MKALRSHSGGDTIVEVLIAVAVISAVLGGAYASAGRSLAGSRQSQERGEALKLVESQLERLKLLGATPAAGVYTAPTPFCLDATPAVSSACDDASLGVTYRLAITRPSSNTFEVKATWERAGGGGNDEAKLIYRIYPR